VLEDMSATRALVQTLESLVLVFFYFLFFLLSISKSLQGKFR
jgi:hypothetical protein